LPTLTGLEWGTHQDKDDSLALGRWSLNSSPLAWILGVPSCLRPLFNMLVSSLRTIPVLEFVLSVDDFSSIKHEASCQ
jgi:hypothetical protein